MASFTDISKLRLSIDDPEGVISLQSFPTTADFPDPFAPQTGYRAEDTGLYYVEDSATPANLTVSDDIISLYLDSQTFTEARCSVLEFVIAKLGKEMALKSHQFGADSYEYNSLKDMREYYEAMLSRCSQKADKETGVSAGRWGAVSRPEIAGGDL